VRAAGYAMLTFGLVGCGAYDLVRGVTVVRSDRPTDDPDEPTTLDTDDDVLPDTGTPLDRRDPDRCNDGAVAFCVCLFYASGGYLVCSKDDIAEGTTDCVDRRPDGAAIDCWADFYDTIESEVSANPYDLPPTCVTADSLCKQFAGEP